MEMESAPILIRRSAMSDNAATAERERVAVETPQAEPAATAEGRDSRGRFSAGNRGGPGNPFGRRVAELKKAALEAVDEEDLRVVMTMLKQKAQGGDVAAAKLLLQYTLGRPTESPDPDRVDLERW